MWLLCTLILVLTSPQKHLMHLKVIQTMSKVPRSVGMSLGDPSFDQSLSVAGTSTLMPLSLGEDDGKINPLAGMGLSDEQYSLILQGIVSGENFMGVVGGGMDGGLMSGKRGLDDSSDGRDGKRTRFEVIE